MKRDSTTTMRTTNGSRRAAAAGAAMAVALTALTATPALADPTNTQPSAAHPPNTQPSGTHPSEVHPSGIHPPGRQGRGALLSLTPLGGKDRAEIVAAGQRQGFGGEAELRRAVRHDVTAYRLLYRTINPEGRPTTASGLLVLPSGTGRRLPTVLHAHGSMTHRDTAPSVNPQGVDHIAALVYAAGGRATVAPDYLGMGKGPGRHPFMHNPSEVTATLDMLTASDTAVSRLNSPHEQRRSLDGRIYVTGFSQGGLAAMATARALNAGAAPRFTLRGLAPGTGEYDLEHVEIPALFDGRVDDTAAVMAMSYFITAQNRLGSPPVYTDPREVFRSPYAAYVEGLFNGEHTPQEILGQLPKTLAELVTPQWYEKLRHLSGPLLDRVRAVDTTCAWAPPLPVTLHTATGDRESPIANTRSCARQLRERGATVRIVDHGSVDHNAAFTHSVLDVTNAFPYTTRWSTGR